MFSCKVILSKEWSKNRNLFLSAWKPPLFKGNFCKPAKVWWDNFTAWLVFTTFKFCNTEMMTKSFVSVFTFSFLILQVVSFPYESWYYLLERYDRALLLIIYLILFDNCWKFSCLVYRFGSFCHQFWHKILPKFPRNGIFFVWMISILSTLCKRPYTFNLFLIYLEKNVKILQKKKKYFYIQATIWIIEDQLNYLFCMRNLCFHRYFMKKCTKTLELTIFVSKIIYFGYVKVQLWTTPITKVKFLKIETEHLLRFTNFSFFWKIARFVWVMHVFVY